MSSGFSLQEVRCTLGETLVLKGVQAAVERGHYACILGASGAGKSTLLRCIAGLVACAGRIVHGERVLQDGRRGLPPHERGIGFLFQGHGLWPELTVEEHLLQVLAARGVRGSEAAKRAADELVELGLAVLRARRPAQLSGGERQRLGLARATVLRPELLLLDEPTSSVDQALKREVRALLFELSRRHGATVLHVTHDHEEAFELADHLICMDRGVVVQEGSPARVHAAPASVAVAGLLGEGTLVPVSADGDGMADTPLGRARVSGRSLAGAAWALVRPEHLELVRKGEGVPATVRRRVFRGAAEELEFDVGGQICRVKGTAAEGCEIWVRLVGAPPLVQERSA